MSVLSERSLALWARQNLAHGQLPATGLADTLVHLLKQGGTPTSSARRAVQAAFGNLLELQTVDAHSLQSVCARVGFTLRLPSTYFIEVEDSDEAGTQPTQLDTPSSNCSSQKFFDGKRSAVGSLWVEEFSRGVSHSLSASSVASPKATWPSRFCASQIQITWVSDRLRFHQ